MNCWLSIARQKKNYPPQCRIGYEVAEGGRGARAEIAAKNRDLETLLYVDDPMISESRCAPSRTSRGSSMTATASGRR